MGQPLMAVPITRYFGNEAMILSTTNTLAGKKIREYRGVVTGEAILGTNLFRDLRAGLRDIVGGRSASYEKELRKARVIALQEIEDAAQQLGTNTIISVDIDYEVLEKNNGMLMVSESGAAIITD